MTKTLGQILSDALPGIIRQEDYEHAAQAVVDAYLGSNEHIESRELDRQYYLSKIDELGDCLTKLRAQEPVIEAAKLFLALEPFRYRCLDYDQQQAVIAVLKTARALQEGE